MEVQRPVITESCNDIRSAVRHGYRIRTALNPKQHAELASLFPNRYIFSDHSRVCPHPILHALLEIATIISYDQATSRVDNDGVVLPFIEIGGAISKTVATARDHSVHSCNLHNSVRDAHRIVEQRGSLQYNDALRQQLIDNLFRNMPMMGSFCGGCTTRCTYKADFGIAIHSIYDMTPLDMYTTFMRHELYSVTATLHIPKELFNPHASICRKYSGQQNSYVYERLGAKALMHFNDGTAGYLHNFDTWSFWGSASGIRGPDFSISIQISAVHGFQYMLHLCRIPNNLVDFPSRFMPADYMSQFILIPDVFEYIQLNDHLDTLTQMVVPFDFYNRLFQYVIKLELANISSIYMFACSIASRIDIATYTVNHEWLADSNIFFRATYSIIFIALASRREAKNNAALLFKIVDDQESVNYMPIRARVSRAWSKMKDFSWTLLPWTKSSFDKTYSNTTDILHCFEPKKFDTIRFDVVHNIDRHHILNNACAPVHRPDYIIDDASDDNVDDDNNANQKPCDDTDGDVDLQSCNSTPTSPPEPDDVVVFGRTFKMADLGIPSKKQTQTTTISANVTPPVILPSITTTTAIPLAIQPVQHTTTNHADKANDQQPDEEIHNIVQEALSDMIDQVVIINHPTKNIIDQYFKNDIKLPNDPHVHTHNRSKFIKRLANDSYDPNFEIIFPNPSHKPNFEGRDEMYNNAIMYLPSYNVKNKCLTKMRHIKYNCRINFRGRGLDIGAGPGGWSSIVGNDCDAIEGPIKIKKNNLGNYKNVFYCNINDFDYRGRSYDYVLCDIGDQKEALKATDDVMHLIDEVSPQLVIHKMWTSSANIGDLIEYYAIQYSEVCLIKPFGSGDLNNEFYLVARNRDHFGDIPCHFVQQIYNEMWCINETISFACREAESFVAHDVYMHNVNNNIIPFEIMVTEAEVSASISFYNNIQTATTERLNIAQSDLTLVDKKIKINSITGVAGCGKSNSISKMFKDKARDCMIIVPTKALADEFMNDARFTNWRVRTVHAALRTQVEHVFVDECFTQPIGLLALIKHFTGCKKIYVTGSTAQIGPIDSTALLAGTRRLHDVIKDVNLNSLRMPHDVTRLLTGIHKQAITTSSDVTRSFIAYDCNARDAKKIIKILGWPVMYFNNASARRNDTMTIHDMQGFTRDRVVLHLDDSATMSDFTTQFQHIVVGMSRHTQYLVLVGRVDRFVRSLYYQNTAFERNDHMFNQGLADFHGKVPRDIRPHVMAVEEKILFPDVDLAMAKTMIDSCIKTRTQDDNEAATQSIDCNKIQSGRMKVKISEFLSHHKSHLKGKHLDAPRVTRRYLPGPFGETKCMTNRYAILTKNGDVHRTTVELLEGLASWCKDFSDLPLIIPPHDLIPKWMSDVIFHASPRAVGLLCKINQLTINAIGGSSIDSMRTYFITEYAKSLQEKGLPATHDRDFEIEQFRRFISFFVKKQVKPDVRNYAEERDKVHQGIAGWKKYQNFMLCSYTRLFTSMFQQLLDDRVIFASNEADTTIAARAASLIADAEDNNVEYKCKAIDFAEFDSRVVDAGPRLNALLMFYMFCPSYLCQEYTQQRSNWVLDTGIIKLLGFDKMHSGEPWTLMGNTLYNMAVIGCVYLIDGLVVAGFKGDDSGIMAKDIKYRNKEFEREHNIELKVETNRSLEFTGIIWNRYGGMPDVIRRATKFTTTVYPTAEAYKLSVINLKAELDILHTNTGFNAGCAQLADYYNEIGRIEPINADLVRCMAGFCYHQSFKTYDTLVDFSKNVMQFCDGKLLTNQQ
uniref:RNA-dependent RNA polymerase n=1 Tax=Riboviria sp. TaxID=2585031 RepID=A0A514D4T2_9VIRU|nr:MAG: RNA-dependent RNA polymerase [Riboviria sp.]